jgi:hypothetical protein
LHGANILIFLLSSGELSLLNEVDMYKEIRWPFILPDFSAIIFPPVA